MDHADQSSSSARLPTTNVVKELLRREYGFSRPGQFNSNFYSSRYVIERMMLTDYFEGHNSCVNSLSFNREGNLLCSGSNDNSIIVWDWAKRKQETTFPSAQYDGIIHTKFMNNAGAVDIVYASRHGEVRRCVTSSAGGATESTLLHKHEGPAYKLTLTPQIPWEVMSVGEDGYIQHKDVRSNCPVTTICKLEKRGTNEKIPLLCIAHHPFAPEICVSGADCFVRVYDKRNMTDTVHEMCPSQLLGEPFIEVSGVAYNSTGAEILASYKNDRIYLFNNTEYKANEYLHSYSGLFNHNGNKDVNFFGPKSDYVVSGSDCGNIFFWNKHTEAIVNFMDASHMGEVSCLEPHPKIPVLASCGLDDDVCIWTPRSVVSPPILSNLRECVKRNLIKCEFVKSTSGFHNTEICSMNPFTIGARRRVFFADLRRGHTSISIIDNE